MFVLVMLSTNTHSLTLYTIVYNVYIVYHCYTMITMITRITATQRNKNRPDLGRDGPRTDGFLHILY